MRTQKSIEAELAAQTSRLIAVLDVLSEAREACAACFRVIAATKDKETAARLDAELRGARVRPGFGARMDRMLSSYARQGLVAYGPAPAWIPPERN